MKLEDHNDTKMVCVSYCVLCFHFKLEFTYIGNRTSVSFRAAHKYLQVSHFIKCTWMSVYMHK